MVLLRPLILISMSAFFIPHTVFNLVTSLQFQPFTSLSSFKDHWFARFWVFFGPLSQEAIAPLVGPLVSQATGTILDIGPGQGHHLRHYANSPNRSKITKIYAVEINKMHHPALLANAQKSGLGDIFEIVDAPVESLESKAGIQRHSIDTIVTLQVLCSVGDQELLIRELRTYLKPNGGKWLVLEHVRRQDNGGIALYQQALNYIWPTFFNGCSLTRDTSLKIEGTGGWDMQKSGGGLQLAEGTNSWSAIPMMMGVLVSE